MRYTIDNVIFTRPRIPRKLKKHYKKIGWLPFTNLDWKLKDGFELEILSIKDFNRLKINLEV